MFVFLFLAGAPINLGPKIVAGMDSQWLSCRTPFTFHHGKKSIDNKMMGYEAQNDLKIKNWTLLHNHATFLFKAALRIHLGLNGRDASGCRCVWVESRLHHSRVC